MESYWDLLPKELQTYIEEFCWSEEVIFEKKYKVWKQNMCYHRDNDLPAIIFPNGDREWYKEEKLHRDNDLPATIYFNGDKEWYKEGNHTLVIIPLGCNTNNWQLLVVLVMMSYVVLVKFRDQVFMGYFQYNIGHQDYN